MKFSLSWLEEHIQFIPDINLNQITDGLTSLGLEVEKVEPVKNELSDFIVAKIIKAENHPNADRLKLCHVDIGKKELVKVVCGGPNAKDKLLTIYAPPGSVIPKNNMKLEVSKIRGETSYGMLCSESELNLSDKSDGITELLKSKYEKKIGESYFSKSKSNLIDLSISKNVSTENSTSSGPCIFGFTM